MDNNIKVGKVVGTGAALNISLGFIPDYFRIINYTDGTRTDEWFEGMTDGHSIATIAAAGPVKNTTNGVTPYAGSSSLPKGITIGTAISTSGKDLYYFACRTSSGA
jgi:hypothetical protein